MEQKCMKAAVLTDPSRIEVKTVPVPPVEPGMIEIDVSACGVCGSDVHMWKTGKGWGKQDGTDFVMGHEFCGVVTNAGAEHYGVTTDQIRVNFNRNKSKYQAGKHFFLLEGDELQKFKGDVTNCNVAENLNKLYLWTEHGALLHAKSLGTDEAWNTYESLIDTYFRAQEIKASLDGLSPQLQVLISLEMEQKQLKADIAQTNQRIDDMRKVVALNPVQWREDSARLINQMAAKLGGVEHIQYIRNEIYGQLDARFGVSLKTRVTRLRQRMADEGICKSRRDKVNKLDVIAQDKKLIEGYVTLVKEMAIKHGVAA